MVNYDGVKANMNQEFDITYQRIAPPSLWPTEDSDHSGGDNKTTEKKSALAVYDEFQMRIAKGEITTLVLPNGAEVPLNWWQVSRLQSFAFIPQSLPKLDANLNNATGFPYGQHFMYDKFNKVVDLPSPLTSDDKIIKPEDVDPAAHHGLAVVNFADVTNSPVGPYQFMYIYVYVQTENPDNPGEFIMGAHLMAHVVTNEAARDYHRAMGIPTMLGEISITQQNCIHENTVTATATVGDTSLTVSNDLRRLLNAEGEEPVDESTEYTSEVVAGITDQGLQGYSLKRPNGLTIDLSNSEFARLNADAYTTPEGTLNLVNRPGLDSLEYTANDDSHFANVINAIVASASKLAPDGKTPIPISHTYLGSFLTDSPLDAVFEIYDVVQFQSKETE